MTLDKKWVRVRDEGNNVTVTLKYVHDTTKIGGVQEIEFATDSFSKACLLFNSCGFTSLAYQENYRENWQYRQTIISIDTWPGLPTFLEIESQNASTVFAVAQELGFDCDTSYYGTVAMLYEKAFGISDYTFNAINQLTFENFPDLLKSLLHNKHEQL